MIVKFTRKGKKDKKPHSGRPWPSEKTSRLVKRNVGEDPRCKAYDITTQADVCRKTAVRYLHNLGYYGRAARRKPLLRPTNIKRRKDWVVEMGERPVAFWRTFIFSDESRFTLFSDGGRVLV